MGEEMRAGFTSAHRQYMRATLRLRESRKQKEPEGVELVKEQREAGTRMVQAMQEAHAKRWEFREFYAAASKAIGESAPFVLLDWDEENELLLGVRLYELEQSIQEEEAKQNERRSGFEVFLGSLASREGFSREISELYKRHAHILWQLVGKDFGFREILSLRNQAMKLSAGEIEQLRKQE